MKRVGVTDACLNLGRHLFKLPQYLTELFA
jgi:hypothetical protein